MVVYRVEHPETRLGPYATPAPLGIHDWGETGATDRCPLHDRKPMDLTVWYFGFENKAQVSAWFTAGQQQRLAQQGFVLSTYEVEPTRVIADSRKTQVVFAGGARVSEVNLSPTEEQNHGA